MSCFVVVSILDFFLAFLVTILLTIQVSIPKKHIDTISIVLILFCTTRFETPPSHHPALQPRYPDNINVARFLFAGLELIRHKGAVLEQEAVYKTCFSNRPEAESAG